MRRNTSLRAFAAVIGTAGCAAALVACKARDTRSDVKLVGGDEAQPGQFPGVVNLGQACTGTVVDAHHIVTAAHCVVNAGMASTTYEALLVPLFKKGRKLDITSDIDMKTATKTPITIADALVHPEFVRAASEIDYWNRCNNDRNCRPIGVRPPFPPDIAVLVTVEPINLPDANFRTAQIEYGLIPTTIDSAPTMLEIVGYGCEKGSNVQQIPSTFRQKAGKVPIVGKEGLAGINTLSLDPDGLVKTYTMTRGMLEDPEAASLCPGDSGGPTFYESPVDHVKRLAGVNSSSWFPGATAGPGGANRNGVAAVNLHTRFDAESAYKVSVWLKEVLSKDQAADQAAEAPADANAPENQ